MRIVIVAFALTMLAFLVGLDRRSFGRNTRPRAFRARCDPGDPARRHPRASVAAVAHATAEAAPRTTSHVETRSHVRSRPRRVRMTRISLPVEKPVRMAANEPKIDPLTAHKTPPSEVSSSRAATLPQQCRESPATPPQKRPGPAASLTYEPRQRDEFVSPRGRRFCRGPYAFWRARSGRSADARGPASEPAFAVCRHDSSAIRAKRAPSATPRPTDKCASCSTAPLAASRWCASKATPKCMCCAP